MTPPDHVIVLALGISTYRERLFGGGPDVSDRVAFTLGELGRPFNATRPATEGSRGASPVRNGTQDSDAEATGAR